MSLLAELQRRKVFKVGAAYLVVGWLLIQIAATLIPYFAIPGWTLRLVTLLVLLGFPLALVMAWMFDVTPEGLQAAPAPVGNKRFFAISAGLVALAIAWYFYAQPAIRKGNSAPAATIAKVVAAEAVASVDPNSIAVLPFLNMSPDASNQYFSDGISEELLNVLAKVNGLGVASRTSSFAFKGREIGSSEIARALKVKFILEGSVRKQGQRVRITAQLIDAVNDRHLWSQTYDRQLADIFAIQDEIANKIVVALRGSLEAAKSDQAVTVRADTSNMQAYDLYLKARELFIARGEDNVRESIHLYESVVEMDPNFARGWEGLAAAYSIAKSWGVEDRDYTKLAESAGKRALQLDPTLSMAWAALGELEVNRLPVDWELHLKMIDRAIAADPRNSTAFLWRSIAWLNLGFFERAIADQDRCLALDPNYLHCNRMKALSLLSAGDTEQAMALFEQGVAAGTVVGHREIFVAPLFRRGDRVGAMLLMQDMGAGSELSRILLSAISHPQAPHPTSDAFARRYLSGKDAKSLGTGRTYLWLGDYDRVGADKDLSGDSLLHWDLGFPGFRNSPGFKRLIERLGVLAYWRNVGYPPQCRAVGANDFTCDAPTLKVAK